MSPTAYPDLNEVLRAFLGAVRGALGAEFRGAYLQGSFALGAADEHSDCDWIVAVARPLNADRAAAVQEAYGQVYDQACPWAQHLEGSFFPLEVLRSCERRGERLWYFDNGSREMVPSTHCNTAVVRQTVRQHGVVLAGPEPTALVDPVPVPLLRREILGTMRGWGDEILAEPGRFRNRFYQGFIVLGYCRMWCDLTLGTVGSKRRGASWARDRLDASWCDLIDRAWDTRPDPEVSLRTPPDPVDFARTLELVRLINGRAAAPA